jgi:hypothetical protein
VDLSDQLSSHYSLRNEDDDYQRIILQCLKKACCNSVAGWFRSNEEGFRSKTSGSGRKPAGSGRKENWFRLKEDLVVLMMGFLFVKELFVSLSIYTKYAEFCNCTALC